MRAPAVIAIMTAASLLAAGVAWACECRHWRNAAEQLNEIDLAFVGRVEETLNEVGPASEPGWRVTRFEVTRTLVGPHRGVRQIAHEPGPEGAVCGISFRRGQEVLVLASTRNGRLATSSCHSPRFPQGDYERAARIQRESVGRG